MDKNLTRAYIESIVLESSIGGFNRLEKESFLKETSYASCPDCYGMERHGMMSCKTCNGRGSIKKNFKGESMPAGPRSVDQGVWTVCSTCDADRSNYGNPECPECHGKINVRVSQEKMKDRPTRLEALHLDFSVCPSCDGEGNRYGRTCSRCGGTGDIESERSLMGDEKLSNDDLTPDERDALANPERQMILPMGEKDVCKWCDSTGAKFQPDPYARDIYNDETLVWICDDCAQERAHDI